MFDPIRSTVKRKKDTIWSLRCGSSEFAASGQSGRHKQCLLLQDPFGPKARRQQIHTSTYAVTAGGLRRCVWGASCRTSWRTPAGSESRGPGWSHQGGASLSASVSERRRKKRKEDESRERLQLGAHQVVYISPVKATIPYSCSRASGAARMGSLLSTRSNSWHPTTRVHATSRRWSSSLHLSRCVLSHSLPHHHFVYDYTFKSHPY